MKKKFLPIFLSLIICFSLVPSFTSEAAYSFDYEDSPSFVNFINEFNASHTFNSSYRKGINISGNGLNSVPDSVTSLYGVLIYNIQSGRVGPSAIFFSSTPIVINSNDSSSFFTNSGGYYWRGSFLASSTYQAFRIVGPQNASDLSRNTGVFTSNSYSFGSGASGYVYFTMSSYTPPSVSEIGFLKNLKYSFNGSEVDFSWDELTSNDFQYDGVEVNRLDLFSGLRTKFTGKSTGATDIGYTQHYITQFPTRNTLTQTLNSIGAWLTNQDVADNLTQLDNSLFHYYFRPYIVENGQKFYGQWISAYYDSGAGRVGVNNDPQLNTPMQNIINNHNVQYIYSDEYYTIEGDEVVNNYDYSTTINNTYNYYTYNTYNYGSDAVTGIDLSSVLKFITDIFNFFYKLVDYLFIPLRFLPPEVISLCKALLVGSIIILIYKVINPFK